MDLSHKIKKFIISQKLIRAGDHIIIGVSGGPDSVFLTHLLKAFQKDFGLKLTIAHVNHHLRKTASKDELLVKKLASELNIPFYKSDWHNSGKAKASLENSAREARYHFFAQLSQKLRADTVALAHTQDDLAETVLMKILRGSGLQGLRGILPLNFIKETKVIRPLLKIKKKELLRFLSANKIRYATDETNFTTDFYRNKIRLKLLPLLEKEYNPNISETLANMADVLTADYDYIKTQSKKDLKHMTQSASHKRITLSLKNLSQCSPSIRRMCLRDAIKKLKGDTNSLELAHLKEIEELIKSRPDLSKTNLRKGMTIQKKGQNLILTIN